MIPLEVRQSDVIFHWFPFHIRTQSKVKYFCCKTIAKILITSGEEEGKKSMIPSTLF